MEDFDVAALAAYLHITPDRVLKLATQGKLPGRRMGGGWRFAEAEIHHWLEERIGARDQEALQQVEAALHRSGRDQTNWSIAELCPVERIAAPEIWPRDPPIRVRKSIPDTWIRLTISEGRNRQVRRMTAAVGHPTLRLVRLSVGEWTLDGIAPGEWRWA